MGSDSSKEKKHQDTSQYGQIYLKTDKTAYFAGETITGTIFLNLISHYPGNKLFLKLKGIEAVHLVKTEGTRIRYDKRYSEKQYIINQSTNVYTWDFLSTGQFTIPFSVRLPPTLPPSFYQQGYRYLAFLEYQLEVFLQPHQESDPKIKYKQPFRLREPIMPSPQGLSWDVTTTLENCFCCEKGSNFFNVKFEKTNYSPGENVKILIKLDNSGTSLKNFALVATLKQRLELRAGGREKNKDLVKIGQQLPGIPGGSNTIAAAFHLTLPRFPTENDFNRQINKKKPSIDELTQWGANHEVMTSNTKSNLIYSSFYWEISCPMDGCEPTLPVSQFPIGILCPAFQLPVIHAPENWEPVTLDDCILVFPESQNQRNDEMVADGMIQNSMPLPQQSI